MLGQKPYLQFIRSNDVADEQIVRSVVARFIGLLRCVAGLFQDRFMRLEQTRKLHRDLLTAARGPRDLGGFRYVRGHGNTDAAKQLNAFGDGVNQLGLFAEMLIEKQVQLVERFAGHLPMMLFVQVSQRHGVREDLVQHANTLRANVFIQAYR